MTERQVDDVDLQLVTVLNREFQCLKHRARVTAAAAIQDLQTDDSRLRRDAAEASHLHADWLASIDLRDLDLGALALARDERRGVGAVTAVVLWWGSSA